MGALGALQSSVGRLRDSSGARDVGVGSGSAEYFQDRFKAKGGGCCHERLFVFSRKPLADTDEEHSGQRDRIQHEMSGRYWPN